MSILQLCAVAQCCIFPRVTNALATISTLLIFAVATLGATLVVPAGGDLQAAINTAAAGDTILLEAGATYQGPFTLTPKSGDSFITIQSSRVSEITGRVSPSQSDLLARLRSNTVAEPVIKTAPGAHHYKLVGLEISTFSSSDFIYDLVRLGSGDSSQTDLSHVPHDLVLDRLWIHGFETQEVQRGISLNSAETSIINSYISDIHAVATDTQAICGWNGPGPYHIMNNYLEAAGENIMFGGADPQIPNLVPSDIEIRANHLSKRLTWKVDDPSYLGHHWAIKNLLELKNARRVTIDGNIFQNNWLDAQTGVPVVFTARNQDGNAPWSTVEYVLFTNNTVTNTQGGVTILKTSPESKGAVTSHITISNNLFDRIGAFNAIILLNAPNDVQITHNTVFKSGSIVTLDAEPGTPKGSGLVIRDNLFSEGGYGVFGSNIGEGTPALEGFYSSYVFTKNNVAGRESSLYPAGNSFVATAQVGFLDYAGGNYRLTSSSVFKNAATDGKDVGVDIDALLAAQSSNTPPPPNPNPTPTPAPSPEDGSRATVQFAAAEYSVTEGTRSVVVTVSRVGDLSQNSRVDYTSTNASAHERTDFTTAAGRLFFAAGEVTKTITVLVTDDGFVEQPEIFYLVLYNAALSTEILPPGVTMITIADNDTSATTANPIDSPTGFITQHYVDFLNREPEAEGLRAWENVLKNCGPGDVRCDRIAVSSAFYRSPEFQDRGDFLYRFYAVSLGRIPKYAEFEKDMSRTSGFYTLAQQESNKASFADDFITREEFIDRYAQHTTAVAYLNALLNTSGVILSNKDALISALESGQMTRAQALRAISESPEVRQKFATESFVVMQYFGYLRRDPDPLYREWIRILNETGDYRTMINGFINSVEYRQRFGER